MISLYPLLLSNVNEERVNHNWKFKYDGFIYTTVWCDVIARVNMENYCQNIRRGKGLIKSRNNESYIMFLLYFAHFLGQFLPLSCLLLCKLCFKLYIFHSIFIYTAIYTGLIGQDMVE
jgi:hypothetical protein